MRQSCIVVGDKTTCGAVDLSRYQGEAFEAGSSTWLEPFLLKGAFQGIRTNSSLSQKRCAARHTRRTGPGSRNRSCQTGC